jgi:hypothetical protein
MWNLIEKQLVHRLVRPPHARHAAILRVKGELVQRDAVGRDAGGADTLAEMLEDFLVAGQETGVADQPLAGSREEVQRQLIR